MSAEEGREVERNNSSPAAVDVLDPDQVLSDHAQHVITLADTSPASGAAVVRPFLPSLTVVNALEACGNPPSPTVADVIIRFSNGEGASVPLVGSRSTRAWRHKRTRYDQPATHDHREIRYGWRNDLQTMRSGDSTHR